MNQLCESFIAIIVLASFTGTGYSLRNEETKKEIRDNTKNGTPTSFIDKGATLILLC